MQTTDCISGCQVKSHAYVANSGLNAGKVAELTGLDRKAVDKAFAEMKKDGTIVSPVRCKWEPANK